MNTIINASINDLPAINNLLKSEDLPLVDSSEFNSYYFKSVSNIETINGAIGLEKYGDFGLLRSLVVNPNSRNEGIAHLLVNQILNISKDLGIKELFLLTTTAEKYFQKKGFLKINRDEAPVEIKASKEYSSICPSSSTIMKINILP